MIDRTGFEKLRVYNMAEELADLVWKVVKNWDYLPQTKATDNRQPTTDKN